MARMPAKGSKPRKPLSAADKALAIDDIRRRSGDNHIKQLIQWVGNASWYADQVIEAPGPAIAAMFWVRLYGALCDTRDELLRLRDGCTSLNLGVPSDVTRTIDALNAVAAKFSDDDLIYIQYRRDTESHPILHAYRVVQKYGSLKKEMELHLLGAMRTVDEVEAVATVVERGTTRIAVAQQFAAKIRQELEAAWEASKRLLVPSA